MNRDSSISPYSSRMGARTYARTRARKLLIYKEKTQFPKFRQIMRDKTACQHNRKFQKLHIDIY